MKNETAKREIESLDYYLQNHTDDYSEESHTAMMMAVKALEQEPCEDAISRQAIIDEMEKRHAEGDCITKGFVKNMPSVTPQPKTGHWINGDCEGGNCSICGEYYAFYPESGDFNYCPNCGRSMVEPQESEDKE